ncbi:hypothetical protein [Kitasatospora azatica]|nr:hypothetical protein [Kitasatospora azatica]
MDRDHFALLEAARRALPDGFTDRRFGERIRIPKPFDFDLDTEGLIPYQV